MSFFDELMTKARSVLGAPPPKGQTDAVVSDRFDRLIFDELLDEAPAVADMVDELNERFDHTRDLLQDVFMEFWQGDPQVRDASDMAPSHLINHAVVNDVQRAPETTQARSYSKFDKYGSALATLGVGDKVREYLSHHTELAEASKEADDAAQEAEAANGELAQALAQADGMPGTPGADGQPIQGPPSPAQQAAAEALAQALAQAQAAQQAAADAQGQAQQAAAQAQAELRVPIRGAVKDAAEALDDEAELFRAWGVDDGQLERLDFTERAQLAAQLRSSRVAKFQQLIGRFKLMEAAQRMRKVEYGRDEVVGTELSGDLARVVPTEYVGFVHPLLRRDFLVRLVEGRLLSRQYRGTERIGDGAIIACVDTSGSMKLADGSGIPREAWAKAFALALLDRARTSKRDFVGINFSSSRQISVHRFPKGQGDIAKVIAFVEQFFNGGTDFEAPLGEATDILEHEFNLTGKQRADVAFITDDECGISPQWMEQFQARKRRLDFRVFGIAVGVGYGQALEALSDNVRSITEFADPDSVADILRVV